MAKKEREVFRNVEALVRPGGTLLGRAGATPDIRILNGTAAAAERLFDEIRRGGWIIDEPTYPGTLVELPGGGRVGFRTFSSKSPAETRATLDVNVPGMEEISKLKFNEPT